MEEKAIIDKKEELFIIKSTLIIEDKLIVISNIKEKNIDKIIKGINFCSVIKMKLGIHDKWITTWGNHIIIGNIPNLVIKANWIIKKFMVDELKKNYDRNKK